MRSLCIVLALSSLACAESLESRCASVLPQPDEDRWRAIPWERNLMEGRRRAQESGKPLLIWIMDGDVLGCT